MKAADIFWKWFEGTHERYRNIGTVECPEELLDQFESRLHEVDPGLFFEISRPLDDGSNELIITAAGAQAKFPMVEALVSAAVRGSSFFR